MRLLLVILTVWTGCGFSVPAGAPDPGHDASKDDAPSADSPAGDSLAADSAPLDTTILPIDASVDAPCPDGDHDGICDAQDTWPCGPLPTAPGDPVTWDTTDSAQRHQTITLTGTSLGGTKLRVVAPGATFSFATSYTVADCICTGCIDQIQVGLVPGTAKKCVYDNNPSCTPATAGSGTLTLTAPATPGVYDVRFRLGQDYECDGQNGDHLGWWTNAAPGAASTVAKICVH